MKKIVLSFYLCLFTLLISGCVSLGGYTVSPLQIEDDFKRGGMNAASFEWNCPEDQMKTKILKEPPMNTIVGATVAVEGCGKKGIYVRSRAGWIKNN